MSFQCVKCSGSGWVVATHKKNGGLYAFKCLCSSSRGRSLAASIPAWVDKYYKDYEPDNFVPSFPDPKGKIIEPKKLDDDIPF